MTFSMLFNELNLPYCRTYLFQAFALISKKFWLGLIEGFLIVCQWDQLPGKDIGTVIAQPTYIFFCPFCLFAQSQNYVFRSSYYFVRSFITPDFHCKWPEQSRWNKMQREHKMWKRRRSIIWKLQDSKVESKGFLKVPKCILCHIWLNSILYIIGGQFQWVLIKRLGKKELSEALGFIFWKIFIHYICAQNSSPHYYQVIKSEINNPFTNSEPDVIQYMLRIRHINTLFVFPTPGLILYLINNVSICIPDFVAEAFYVIVLKYKKLCSNCF